MRFFIFALTLILGSQTAAQGTFQPVITVNDRAITGFELDQRIRMLEVFQTAGDLDKTAREALIEDRLKEDALARAGLRMTEESLLSEMTNFAERAEMDLDEFLQLLGTNSVSEQSLRDFVRIGVSWRDYVRSRFGSQATITDSDVNRAIAQIGTGGAAIQVLLSEIIIAAPPERAAEAMEIALEISQLRSTSAFEAQARRVSGIPSRENGGRLGWLPITNYPPQLQSVMRGLSPGEVTAPLPIENGIALFQLRAIREVQSATVAPSAVDYAVFYLADGQSDAGLYAAQKLADSIDTCGDLYGEAKGLPENVLDRQSIAPADIPQDIAIELARLDTNEASYNLTRSNGETLMFLMLCERKNAATEDIDPASVRNQLRSQRLANFSDALLEDLRSSAIITTR